MNGWLIDEGQRGKRIEPAVSRNDCLAEGPIVTGNLIRGIDWSTLSIGIGLLVLPWRSTSQMMQQSRGMSGSGWPERVNRPALFTRPCPLGDIGWYLQGRIGLTSHGAFPSYADRF